jgi:plastocyanin
VHRSPRAVSLLLFATLVIVSCGTDGPAEPGLQVNLVADENFFDPAETTAIAGDVTFTITNKGAVPHRFDLLDQGVRITRAIDFDPATSLGQVVLGRDAEMSTTLTLAPGVYQYVCLIPAHLEAGMAGVLTVQ